jgi:hypothetical protein
MDLNDLTKDLERIGLPKRPRDRRPDLGVKHGKLKALVIRVLAFLLLAIVGAFGLLVISHYKSTIMLLIVLVYFGLGAFLAYKLFSLTYVGWLYTLLLSAAGVLMPILALVSRGFSSPTLAMGAVAVIIISLGSAALLWWAKDLFGIKSYREIFMPYI